MPATETTNLFRWIEFLNTRFSKTATKFPPFPGGEGRGERERKYTTIRWLASLQHKK
jgi:hypothetical protein